MSTSLRLLKDRLNEQFARIGHALASPKRIELMELLHQCEKSVETLSLNTSMSAANTSRHLQILRAAGLVECRRDGLRMYYRLADDQVFDLVSSLRRVAETRLADVERVLTELEVDPASTKALDRSRLLKLAKAGKIVILDVRPEDEYAAAHIPHAVSIPLDKLKDYLNQLPHHQQYVAYCRGRYCLLAGEAVRLLHSQGLRAIKLGEGVAEWRAAGQPVVTGQTTRSGSAEATTLSRNTPLSEDGR